MNSDTELQIYLKKLENEYTSMLLYIWITFTLTHAT